MARRRKTGRDLHGILLLDKRKGVSSNRALQEVRRLYDANKAGHTGSLDPLATGLLPICFGEATKASAFMLENDKRYQVVIQLGVTTDTGDAEGKVLNVKLVPPLERDEIQAVLNLFSGEITQVPPMYSALKHQGRPLYELAREGKTVERKTRKITIYELQFLDFKQDQLTLNVWCSKGTYIRTLAEDIGAEIGCGATVKELRRLEAGRFKIDKAYTFEQLQVIDSKDALDQCLLPVDEPLQTWPGVKLAETQAAKIRHGGQVMLPDTDLHGAVRIYAETGFLGIGEILCDGRLIPKRLFHLV